jgi:hypothetical protein
MHGMDKNYVKSRSRRMWMTWEIRKPKDKMRGTLPHNKTVDKPIEDVDFNSVARSQKQFPASTSKKFGQFRKKFSQFPKTSNSQCIVQLQCLLKINLISPWYTLYVVIIAKNKELLLKIFCGPFSATFR